MDKQEREGLAGGIKAMFEIKFGEFREEDFVAVARELGETSLMFLVHPTLEAVHMEKTVQVVRDVMGEAVG